MIWGFPLVGQKLPQNVIKSRNGHPRVWGILTSSDNYLRCLRERKKSSEFWAPI